MSLSANKCEEKQKIPKLHEPRIRSGIGYFGEAAFQFWKDAINILAIIGEIAEAVYYAVKNPRKIRWRETLYYMDVCGADALPISCLICFLMGLILGFQGAIQMHKFGTDLYVADLVGLSIVKELGPLMVAMICTGRAGSAFAAEISTMKVSEEIDAMITMGFIPSRFLIIPKLLALVLVMPILTVFGNVMGILGGMTVGVFSLGLPAISYFNRTVLVVTPRFFTEGLVKSAVFAVLIAAVGCLRGMEASNDTHGVGRAATSAVVSGIFLVIVADTLMTYLFSKL
ncbi:MAG: ABC transporter permease [Victivallales bacterium]|jgi:phospholipid/cholesterol/gamma-HCH transport system permease protein